jgi:hypothetical protein
MNTQTSPTTTQDNTSIKGTHVTSIMATSEQAAAPLPEVDEAVRARSHWDTTLLAPARQPRHAHVVRAHARPRADAC